MKYLKKFNENKEEIDVNYLIECFVDLIDEGAEYGVDSDEHGDWFCLNIDAGVSFQKANEIIQEILYSIEKIKIKYPDVDFNIENKGDGEIGLYIKI